jgi:hypothetical protein
MTHDFQERPILVNLPVALCPECRDFSEMAMRRWSIERGWRAVVSRLSGRSTPVEEPAWISTSCPECGARLVKCCPVTSCAAPIASASDEHCRRCGHLYPWRVPAARRGQNERTDGESVSPLNPTDSTNLS